MFDSPSHARVPDREHDVPFNVATSKSVLPRINSDQLFAGARDLLIEHVGQEYRLRLTRNNKLILTK